MTTHRLGGRAAYRSACARVISEGDTPLRSRPGDRRWKRSSHYSDRWSSSIIGGWRPREQRVSAGSRSMAMGFGSVWVCNIETDELWRIDPGS